MIIILLCWFGRGYGVLKKCIPKCKFAECSSQWLKKMFGWDPSFLNGWTHINFDSHQLLQFFCGEQKKSAIGCSFALDFPLWEEWWGKPNEGSTRMQHPLIKKQINNIHCKQTMPKTARATSKMLNSQSNKQNVNREKAKGVAIERMTICCIEQAANGKKHCTPETEMINERAMPQHIEQSLLQLQQWLQQCMQQEQLFEIFSGTQASIISFSCCCWTADNPAWCWNGDCVKF